MNITKDYFLSGAPCYVLEDAQGQDSINRNPELFKLGDTETERAAFHEKMQNGHVLYLRVDMVESKRLQTFFDNGTFQNAKLISNGKENAYLVDSVLA